MTGNRWGLIRRPLSASPPFSGSVVARGIKDPVFVRGSPGHSKLAATDRYVSAKLRLEEFQRLDRAFRIEPEQTVGRRTTPHDLFGVR